MAEIGVLTEEDNVELLEGWIVPKMTKKPPHEWAVTQLGQLLRSGLGDEWLLRTQCAIDTADSEPEPDGAVVRAPNGRYKKRHPQGPEDIGLVIEVADTSLAKDRRKAAIYAADAISCYWLINLVDSQIEVHTDPQPQERAYGPVQILNLQDEMELTLDGQILLSVPVDQLVPTDE